MGSVMLLAATPPLLPIVLPLALGLAAIWLLVPRPRPYPMLWGAGCGGLALLLAGRLLIHAGGFTPETVLFYAFSGIAVVSGAMLVTQRHPARAALSFALVVLSTCGLFLLQAAPFLMAATTIIYAGAIIVTFLFVLMLAKQEGRSDADQRSREPLLAVTAGFILLGALLYVLNVSYDTRTIDGMIARLEDASAQDSVDKMAASIKEGGKFFDALAKHVEETTRDQHMKGSSGTDDSPREKIEAAGETWDEGKNQGGKAGLEKMKGAVRDALALACQARAAVADLQPRIHLPMSDFSGPPPGSPVIAADEKWDPADGVPIRQDARGNSQLPARNVAALGRSLFTDYLLAVELGGLLLLVATIGAIAIANQREEVRS